VGLESHLKKVNVQMKECSSGQIVGPRLSLETKHDLLPPCIVWLGNDVPLNLCTLSLRV
jgi:hypothetical protein